MRHRKKLNHLGRTSSHRKAMLANMASSLILHKRITTTVAKAKALRIYVEPLITKSKTDSTHSRRTVFSYLKDKHAVSELFREVSPKIADRPGGYTRILKTGARLGDNADMCIIELVDYNENMLAAGKETKPAAKRKRRGRGKKGEPAAEASSATPKKQQDKKETQDLKDKQKAPGREEKSETAREEKKEDQAAVTKEKTAGEQKKEEPAEESREEATGKKDADTDGGEKDDKETTEEKEK
jgi:large subunit ribosomal protein L17